MKESPVKIIAVNLLVLLVLLGLLEAVAQIVALWRPSYDVLFLEPDRTLGWKQVPNLQYVWAGHQWYAGEFRVVVRTNSFGFRDIERSFSAAPGVTRVALLGDSFIEAVQVPLEDTAARRLERRLNSPGGIGTAGSWEVINCGISNYGIGQYLLAWQHYASRFTPRYVAVFVAKLHMERTFDRYEHGAFGSTRNRQLWIRPTFKIENDALVSEPARDTSEVSQLQDQLIRSEFGDQRIRRKQQLALLYYGKRLYERLAARRHEAPALDTLLPVNLRILKELGEEVAAAGGRLAVIDASRDFGDPEAVADALKSFCTENRFAYIPVYRDLMDARRRGIQTHWSRDAHFNEEGNAILADALYAWIAGEAREGAW